MKSQYEKLKPKLITYRKYNNLSKDIFRVMVIEKMQEWNMQDITLDILKQIFLDIGNQAPFMNKTLNKLVIDRSRLKSRYRKNNTSENWIAYKKQHNLCVSSFRKKKGLSITIWKPNPSQITSYFGKLLIKPSFSDKTISNENITLVESKEIITDEKRVSEIFNEYFGNIVASLNIPKTEFNSKIIEGINDTVSTAIKRYELHPSIMKINSIISADQRFQRATREEILKASHDDGLPAKIIKANSDIISEIIYNNFNCNVNFFIVICCKYRKTSISAIRQSSTVAQHARKSSEPVDSEDVSEGICKTPYVYF